MFFIYSNLSQYVCRLDKKNNASGFPTLSREALSLLSLVGEELEVFDHEKFIRTDIFKSSGGLKNEKNKGYFSKIYVNCVIR